MSIASEITAKKEQVDKIVFFFPYRGVGGVSVLFLNLALDLVQNDPSLDVALIDYPDGYMAKHCHDKRIEVWPLRKNQAVEIPEESVFVMQSAPMWRLPHELKFAKKTRLLFWHLHPLNIVPGSFWGRHPKDLFPGLWWGKFMLTSLRRRKLRKLLELCHARKGLVFMDGANSDMAQAANGCVLENPRYLPVPSREPVMSARQRSLDDKTLRCAWIGRLEDFKIPVLVYTLRKLAKYRSGHYQKIIFDVIGSGSEQEQVAQIAPELAGTGVELNMLGPMENDLLGGYLLRSVDLLFAMGIAALDGASVGIPVILLDFSYEPIQKDYEYRFLYQTERYTLGAPMGGRHFRSGNRSLEAILDRLPVNYAEVAARTLEYYKRCHAPDIVRQAFLASTQQTELKFSDIEQGDFLHNDLLFRAIYAIGGIDCRVPSN